MPEVTTEAEVSAYLQTLMTNLVDKAVHDINAREDLADDLMVENRELKNKLNELKDSAESWEGHYNELVKHSGDFHRFERLNLVDRIYFILKTKFR